MKAVNPIEFRPQSLLHLFMFVTPILQHYGLRSGGLFLLFLNTVLEQVSYTCAFG